MVINKKEEKEIEQIKIKKGIKVSELLDKMKNTAFNARKIGDAASLLVEMIKNKECKIFLGMAGALTPAGMKNIIIDMLDYTHVFVTTGAILTHDLIEALNHKHYLGNENASDILLHKNGINRIYNVYMKNEVYQDLGKFFDKNWCKLKNCKTIKELLWKIGSLIKKEDSILKKCYEKKIPIFCPALADSGIGLMIWGKKAGGKKEDDIKIDAFEDMKEIIDIAWKCKVKGVIYIGGGVPKNFIQQSMQFSTPAKYGIQITIDKPEYGGSSGALLQEGISWGKENAKGKFVNVLCDATIALPLLIAYVKDKVKK